MIKVGDRVEIKHTDKSGIATVKIGPYPLEFQAKYMDGRETTFVDDVYDIVLEGENDILGGVRRRYLKKVKA